MVAILTKQRKTSAPFVNIRKVNDIDAGKYSKIEFDYSPVDYNPDGTVEERIKIKPIHCSVFGCGAQLSRTEKLCGSKCLKHQGPTIDITNCMSI